MKSEKQPLFILLPNGNITKNTIMIEGDKYHHLAEVKRVKINDRVTVSFNSGKVYSGFIKEIASKKIIISVIEESSYFPSTNAVTLSISLLKGEKMDWVVQKSTEIGIDAIIPIETKYSIVKWDNKTSNNKIARYKKIAEAASEQSERENIPKILPKTTLKELFSNQQDKTKIFFFHERNGISLDIAKQNIGNNDNILILIGPEGGWDSMETEFILSHKNVIPVNLGTNILRAETAAIVATFAFCHK